MGRLLWAVIGILGTHARPGPASQEQRATGTQCPHGEKTQRFDFWESLSTDTLYSTHTQLSITWLTTLLKFSSGQITAGQFSTLPHQVWLLEPHQLHRDAQFSKSNLFEFHSMKWRKLKRPANEVNELTWSLFVEVFVSCLSNLGTAHVLGICCSVKVTLYNFFLLIFFVYITLTILFFCMSFCFSWPVFSHASSTAQGISVFFEITEFYQLHTFMVPRGYVLLTAVTQRDAFSCVFWAVMDCLEGNVHPIMEIQSLSTHPSADEDEVL